MPKIHQYPFLRLLIPLMIGILLGDFTSSRIVGKTITLFLSLLFLIYLIHHRYLYKRYSLRWFSGIFSFAFLFSAGYTLIQISTPLPVSEVQDISTLGEISSIEKRPSGWDQVTFKPLLSHDLIDIESNGNWLLLTKHEISERYRTYDQVVVKGTLRPLEKPSNPNSFDYGRHLLRRGFSGQMFISDTLSMKLVKREKKVRFSQIPQIIRTKCEKIYTDSGVDSTAMSVVKAILLGDRSDINKEVNQQFVKSGVIHILAVSGLHVGIIYLIINYLLSTFLKPHSHSKWIISVALLLGYAFITGFSPSVSRAVLMFSIIQIGQSSHRDINMYQLISLSAFILLLIEPQFIFNMGFWLSHLAVAGIIAFYPIISGWLTFKFPVWRWGWSIISVSTSAQLSTFPLSLYTFGAFPLYFLLSNILILPIVAPILIIAIMILVLSPFHFISNMLSGLLNDLIHYMVDLTEWINSLPYSYIELIWVSLALMITLYIALFYLFQVYQTSSARNFLRLGPWLVLSLVIINIQFISKISYSGMVIYDTNKGLLIDLFHRGHTVTIESEGFTSTSKSYVRDGLAKRHQLKTIKNVQLYENEPSIKKIKINEQIYYIINGFSSRTLPSVDTYSANGVILRGNNKFDLKLLLEKVHCPLIIATNETSPWILKKWNTISEELNRSLHSINNEGAKSITILKK